MGLLLGLALAAQAATLEVRADARVELIGLVQQLADNNPFPRSPELERRLGAAAALRGHEAVRLLRAMEATGFRGNIPSNWIVYLGEPPRLEVRRPPPEFFAANAGGADRLESFRLALSDFARRPQAKAWLGDRGSSSAVVEAFRRALGTAPVEDALVGLLGAASWERWRVVPSALYPPGATSSWVLEQKPGLPDVYTVVGPSWDGGTPYFRGGVVAAGDVWDEPIWSTTYVLYELCRPVAPSSASVAGLCGGFPGLYPAAENCVQQVWVSAIVARLEKRLFGAAGPLRGGRRFESAVAAVDAELDRFERLPAGRLLLDEAPRLLAPFFPRGRAPECRFVDRDRFQEEVYSRRLRLYLELRRRAGDRSAEDSLAELAAAWGGSPP